VQLDCRKEDEMSIFGKKPDESSYGLGGQPAMPPSVRGSMSYGIGDVIRLLRTLPVDQHGELVVRVIRTTLESVNVHVSSLIEDASKQQHKLSERISTLQSQILELTKQIDTHREEVARLEADLAETTSAKERLKSAEQAAAAVAGAGMPMSHVPPPPPLSPPIKSAPPKPPEHIVAKN
jgi:hypothetical protein